MQWPAAAWNALALLRQRLIGPGLRACPRAGRTPAEWLLSAERRRRCGFGLEGFRVGCPRELWSAEQSEFELDEAAQPLLKAWPIRLAPQCNVAPRAVTIQAPADLVWSVMLDFDAYPDWNPFQSRILVLQDAHGDRWLRMYVQLLGSRLPALVSTEQVFYVDDERRILAYGLTDATPVPSFRAQWLEARGPATTVYHSFDTIGGNLTAFVPSTRVQTRFEEQHEALKRRCESLHRLALEGKGGQQPQPQLARL